MVIRTHRYTHEMQHNVVLRTTVGDIKCYWTISPVVLLARITSHRPK